MFVSRPVNSAPQERRLCRRPPRVESEGLVREISQKPPEPAGADKFPRHGLEERILELIALAAQLPSRSGVEVTIIMEIIIRSPLALITSKSLSILAAILALAPMASPAAPPTPAPGTPPPGFGAPLAGLTAVEMANWQAGLAQFQVVETPETGLGPIYNNVSCVACHSREMEGAGSAGSATQALTDEVGR